MNLQESLRDPGNCANRDLIETHFESRYSRAGHWRQEPFKTLARPHKAQRDGILTDYKNGTTSAAIEAINRKLQLARKRARGVSQL